MTPKDKILDPTKPMLGRLMARLAQHDGCSRFCATDSILLSQRPSVMERRDAQSIPRIEKGARTQIEIINGEWRCLCGNTAADYGFHPVNSDGALIDEPVEGGWFRCDHCEHLIHTDTGMVKPEDTREEKLVAAINALECEWRASYEHPGFVSVTPFDRNGPTGDLSWSFGYEKHQRGEPEEHWQLLGNDDQKRNVESVSTKSGHIKDDALFCVNTCREQAIKRAYQLNGMLEEAVKHIERTTASSPEQKSPWWDMNGQTAYDAAWRIVNKWRQR